MDDQTLQIFEPKYISEILKNGPYENVDTSSTSWRPSKQSGVPLATVAETKSLKNLGHPDFGGPKSGMFFSYDLGHQKGDLSHYYVYIYNIRFSVAHQS